MSIDKIPKNDLLIKESEKFDIPVSLNKNNKENNFSSSQNSENNLEISNVSE